MFKIRVLNSVDIDKKIIQDIVSIDTALFRLPWSVSDVEEFFTNKDNIRIVLELGAGKIVGCFLGRPHNAARIDLQEDDPLIQEDSARYYIESTAVLSEYQKRGGLSKMFEAFEKELKSKKIYRISVHARVPELSEFIQKKTKATILPRRINKWKYYYDQGPTDYIEADLK